EASSFGTTTCVGPSKARFFLKRTSASPATNAGRRRFSTAAVWLSGLLASGIWRFAPDWGANRNAAPRKARAMRAKPRGLKAGFEETNPDCMGGIITD